MQSKDLKTRVMVSGESKTVENTGKLTCWFVVGVGSVIITRMWADAQRDGRPAKYRWRPLFNAAVWLTPTTRVPCSNTTMS